jgi:outer membrane protein OmpA-like peptidoglycan-associated protein
MRKLTILLTSAVIFNGSVLASDLSSNPYGKNTNNRTSTSNTRINPITKGNFLIVGSFSYQKNGENFAKYLRERSHSANLGFYKGNNHFYVYLYESGNLDEVRSRRDKVRLNDEFRDAWVLKVGETFASRISSSGSEVIIAENKPLTREIVEETPKETAVVENEVKANVKQYKVYLNTIEATTYREVPANIKMVYGDLGKMVGTYEAHKANLLEVPADQKQEAQFVCEVFGYKKIEQDLNFADPVNENSKSYTKVVNDTIMLDFELVRYKKGEIFTMFNVFFYNDAAIMLPKSTYELNELVRMVKENENLVIKLHGHTNGNQFGKIIKLEENDKDYFDLKPSNIHTKGSAKDLSFERADIIKRYLIEQGIEERRIEVKGWGGSKMLYPTKSPDAKKNVRVEIEILRD